MRYIRSFALISALVLCSFAAYPYPSGGPYGPVHQKYDLPKVSGKIYYAAPDGKAENSGSSLSAPTTIEAAIEHVTTGDAIILRGGVYRTGNLELNQGITIQPYQDEQPVLKGTYVASEWRDLGNGLWKTSWTRFFPAGPDTWWSRDRYGKTTPLYIFNNDMVFVDGRFLMAVGRESEVTENTYFIDYDAKQVYIGTNPKGHLVEITAFDAALIRTTGEVHGKVSDRKGPTIKGITFTQYAYRALDIQGKDPDRLEKESEHGKDVVGTTLENCSITFCSRVAAYFKGDHLTIRNCKISDTSTEGIYIIASSDVLLEKNIFERNNIERITGYYPAAVKVFNQSYRVTCRDNLVIDLPWSNGIWYDVGEVDGVFVDNWIEGVGDPNREFADDRPYPSQNGFFFEISKGVVCAGNVFVNCDQGMFILNSSNAQIYNNTFVNSTATISRNGRTPENDRTFGWHSSTGPDVKDRKGHVFVNNLLTGDQSYRRPLLFVYQPAQLCSELATPMLKEMDNNVYVNQTGNDSLPAILWSPVLNGECQSAYISPEALNKAFPEFAKESLLYGENTTVFMSRELGHYEVLPSFPGLKAAARVPADVEKLMGTSGKFVGAYPAQD